jgi:hypothetical protein
MSKPQSKFGRTSYNQSIAALVLNIVADAKRSSQPKVFISLILDFLRKEFTDQPNFCQLAIVGLLDTAERAGLLN